MEVLSWLLGDGRDESQVSLRVYDFLDVFSFFLSLLVFRFFTLMRFFLCVKMRFST